MQWCTVVNQDRDGDATVVSWWIFTAKMVMVMMVMNDDMMVIEGTAKMTRKVPAPFRGWPALSAESKPYLDFGLCL